LCILTSASQGEDGHFFPGCYECARHGWFDEAICDSVADMPVVNCGVVYGTADALISSMRQFTEILITTKFQCWDQMLWSLQVWLGGLNRILDSSVMFAYAETSTVCTVATAGVIELDGLNRVLNLKGDVCMILHQYDRFDSVREWIENDKVPQNDAGHVMNSVTDAGSDHRLIAGGLAMNIVVSTPGYLRQMMCSSPYRIRPPRPNSVCYQERLSDSVYKSRLLEYGNGFEVSSTSRVINRV